MKIAIIGSRELPEEWIINNIYPVISNLKQGTKVISGGAIGVDAYVEKLCRDFNIPIVIIRPINPANKIDYLYRNVEIITKADKLIAFWDGKSKGTKFVIDYANARNKEVEVIIKDGK
jgi:hypothetical protein